MAELLGQIAFEFSIVQPLLPTYLHVILSALFSIYTGAHASLSIPSSAAKPSKPVRPAADDDDGEDSEDEGNQQKMEGLSPVDAIMFPLLAGCTLAGLYFLIKWLEDPTLLNKILNWYFSVFGVLSVARLLTDSMSVVTSYIFPTIYTSDGEVWTVDRKGRKAESTSSKSIHRDLPLPGQLSKLELSPKTNEILWILKELPSRQLHVHAYVHKIAEARFRIGPQGFSGLILAVLAILYFNLIDKPWWLTNVLGLSFAYSALQLMSPTTFWTGTMILSSLFVYDIYFVFFTPLMVTVAKKLDIPIKLLFPRPAGLNEDPSKQSLAMLGLGDIVLPGIMIGLALRFDLYLFYLRKQTRQAKLGAQTPEEHDSPARIVEAKWYPAAGGWGERFWVSRRVSGIENKHLGGLFPKTYFHTSLVGYATGMIITLSIMQVYGHAQPALLYLVPGVLGSLWATAFVRGEAKLMWEYNEAMDEDSREKASKSSKGLESIFSLARQEKIVKRLEGTVNEGAEDLDVGDSKEEKGSAARSTNQKSSSRTRKELMFFSISLPSAPRPTFSSEEKRPSSTKAKLPTRPSIEDELRVASQEDLGRENASEGGGLHHRRSGAEQPGEPAGKRQRTE